MNTAVLRIEGEMSIYRARELRENLAAALAQLDHGSDLVVDLGAVTELDSSGVQLLMSAQLSAAAAQTRLRLCAISPAVAEVFATLGLATHFNDSSSRTSA